MPVVEQRKAALDALEGADALAFELDQHALRVLVRAAPDLVCLTLAVGDDLRGANLSGAGELALLDEESGLLLGASQDALGLLLGALDDALGLFVDSLGSANLLRHGNPQLVEQVERPR